MVWVLNRENLRGGIALKSDAFHLHSCLRYFHDPVHFVQINTNFTQALQLHTGIRFGHERNMILNYTPSFPTALHGQLGRYIHVLWVIYICILKEKIKLYKIRQIYFSSTMRKPLGLFFLGDTECSTLLVAYVANAMPQNLQLILFIYGDILQQTHFTVRPPRAQSINFIKEYNTRGWIPGTLEYLTDSTFAFTNILKQMTNHSEAISDMKILI